MKTTAKEMENVVSELNDTFVDQELANLLKRACNAYGPTSIGSRKFSIASLLAEAMAEQASTSEEVLDILEETVIYLETMTSARYLAKLSKLH